MVIKLNLGCGHEILDGYVNIDLVSMDGIDLVMDIEIDDFPYPPGSVDEIRAYDIMEHLKNVPAAMKKFWNLLKPGGLLRIRVPDAIRSPITAFTDPTHIHFFTENSFDYWDPSTKHGSKYGYQYDYKFKIVHKHADGKNIYVDMEKVER